MITQGIGCENIDLRFHLMDKTHGWLNMEVIPSMNYSGLRIDDRPIDIYLDCEDINKIISALQKLKRRCGYNLED